MYRRFLTALTSVAGLLLFLSGVSTTNALLPLHASRTTPSPLDLPLDPVLRDLSKLQSEALPSLSARSETNAQRLARGLSPNRPRKYYSPSRNARGLRARQSSTPCPIPRRQGVIAIIFQDASSGPGFLGKDTYDGMYQFTTELEEALTITIGGCDEDISPGSIFHIETPNGLAAYPYLGASKGPLATSADMTSGSYNYAVMAGTVESQQGPAQSGPSSFKSSVLPTESAMWTFSAVESNRILPAWTNSDGSINTQLTILYNNGGPNSFQITGDLDAFRAEYGYYSVSPASWTMIDIVL
ncbi:hypothetical protein C8Q80DRAFT_245963 [Daedaleopsis nitida]|nr:hypothetical protein C8Q80DRAFT_245963 [Daedaleopsis nitida]